MSARGLVILDRDGTLIDFHRDPQLGVVTPAFHPSQLRLLRGVVEAVATLRGAGWLLALASNQPGAAKGELPAAAIEATMAALEGGVGSPGRIRPHASFEPLDETRSRSPTRSTRTCFVLWTGGRPKSSS